MQVIRDPASTASITDPHIRRLVEQRIYDLGKESFDLAEVGYFLVIEPGDSLETINAQIGFNLLTNRVTGIGWDQPGFTPSFEFVEEFSGCYDTVFVIGADKAIEIFISKDEGVPAELLVMCQRHATPGTV